MKLNTRKACFAGLMALMAGPASANAHGDIPSGANPLAATRRRVSEALTRIASSFISVPHAILEKMLGLTVAAAICAFAASLPSIAVAEPVGEATVEKACGAKLEGGCIGKLCATGCTIKEGGKLVDYGCTFPSRTGKTKATCTRTVFNRTVPGTPKNSDAGGTGPVLKVN